MPVSPIQAILLLALGSILVHISNYSYEPSLSSRKAAGKDEILSSDVVGMITNKLHIMSEDILQYRSEIQRFHHQPKATMINDSSLFLQNYVPPETIDIVVTPPPYLNNCH